MADKGWIKLHRSIMDSGVYSDNLRFKAWVDLILRANHDDKEWFDHGVLVQVKKGQCITSIRQLAESWNCSKSTVDTILKQFVKMDMIKRENRTGKYTIITLIKYGFYQGNGKHRSDTDWDTDQDTQQDTDWDTDQDTDWDTGQGQTRINKNIENVENYTRTKEAAPRRTDSGGFVIEE